MRGFDVLGCHVRDVGVECSNHSTPTSRFPRISLVPGEYLRRTLRAAIHLRQDA
ncbi:hypothetical protein GGD56_001833 [Rhizobium mongolense]|uniref:Uncharacterized protein n=2 Tax=Rhizobium mongolense TaxID=57676 RepID=A0ABR6IJF3_9HYPH|nr:hypothetical protein [Rhizobium mongolense]TVZ64842.1 hypothetical protein BCL32_5112 [Rhizobium mongolense USDA 1844]